MAMQSLDHIVTWPETRTGRLSSVFAAFRTRSSRESQEPHGLGAMRGLAFILLAESIIGVIGLLFFGWLFQHVLR